MATFEEWLQSRLTAHRFPVGEIDGKIGPSTIAAIKAFQKSHGMEETGRADEHTVALLRASSSVILPEIKAQIPDRDNPPPIAAPPSTIKWPRYADNETFFGAVGTNQTSVDIPFDMFLAWDKGSRVRKMTVHQKVAASVSHCLERVSEVYTADERKALGLDLFGGSLNVRRMRGGTKWSTHSWGIAIDFDPERNQLHWGSPQARLSHADAVPFWVIWESQGALSLGRAQNRDWMHLQFCGL